MKKRGTVARNHHEVMLEPLYESDLEEDEDEDEQGYLTPFPVFLQWNMI